MLKLAAAFILLAAPAFADDYTISSVGDLRPDCALYIDDLNVGRDLTYEEVQASEWCGRAVDHWLIEKGVVQPPASGTYEMYQCAAKLLYRAPDAETVEEALAGFTGACMQAETS